ncbi:MAG: glycosyltransferase [Alphaproteobacteria bacterium]|nr:glycosyltransferase [Alphaproteobacteria bacterium]
MDLGLLESLSLLTVIAWGVLICCRGDFWRARERLDGPPGTLSEWPSVAVLIPARDEAAVIGRSLPSVLNQDYPGRLHVILIDDHSRDGTAEKARAAAKSTRRPGGLSVIRSKPLPAGWTGKVWALAEGLARVPAAAPSAEYLWLTDADIAHDPYNLRRLVSKAARGDLDLVSQMVVLVSEGFWARLLIPAFVFFFQKLYPFGWANNPARNTAAAAGGCVLLRKAAIDRAGGFVAIRDALIDDCALARLVKARGRPDGGRLWVGLTTAAASLRPYGGLEGIWRMVARSAFTQLRHSVWLLLGTIAGMTLLYLAPPALTVTGLVTGNALVAWTGGAAWLLMTVAFLPTLRLYAQPLALALFLPAAGFLFSLMTLDSAVAYWRGQGGAWKGRTLSGDAT